MMNSGDGSIAAYCERDFCGMDYIDNPRRLNVSMKHRY